MTNSRAHAFRLLVALSVASASGCVASPPQAEEQAEATGKVLVQLVGTGVSGDRYQLRDAVLTVQGPSSTLFFDTEEDPELSSWAATIPVGVYDAFLQEGWHLEHLADGKAERVDAELLSINPQTFNVSADDTTQVGLRFRVTSEPAHHGNFEIVLEVLDSTLPDGICESDDHCSDGEVCCIAGFLGTCVQLEAGAECPLPDLTVSADTAEASLEITEESFEETSCAVAEACIDAPGFRRLLRFSTQTPNIGDADLILGSPTSDAFEWAQCHQHYHFNGYARYELLNAEGETQATGRKQAFCLLDSAQQDPEGTETPRFHCGFQGIQSGWSDIYSAGLDCQWVDITDVAPGNYTLRITINSEQALPESNYLNNVAEVPVVVPPPRVTDPTAACSFTEFGIFRDCGFDVAPQFQGATCTPGELVNVTCGCADTPVCGGDPILRACAGDEPCRSSATLNASDDACGACPAVSFTCPQSGLYTVLSGPYASNQSFTCDVTRVAELPSEE